MNITRLALALGLSLVTVAGVAGQGRNAQLVILDAKVTGNLLTVTGMNFGGGRPVVILGGTFWLPVTPVSHTQLKATLNPLPPPGTYLLSVMRSGRGGKKRLGTFDLTLGAVGIQGIQGDQGDQKVTRASRASRASRVTRAARASRASRVTWAIKVTRACLNRRSSIPFKHGSVI